MTDKCPGSGIRSKGKGQLKGYGKGKGPIGVPLYKKKLKELGDIEYADIIQYEEW